MFAVTACHPRALPICLGFKRFANSYSLKELERQIKDGMIKDKSQSILKWIFRAPEGELPITVRWRNKYWRKGGYEDYLKTTSFEAEAKGQTYDKARHLELGPDLSAALFVLFRGGGVKFSNLDEWLYSTKEKSLVTDLPSEFDENYILTGIDLCQLDLRVEALTNFYDLTRVTHLSIAFCPRADDWWLDSISGKLPALEHLVLAGCPKITYRGISSLYRCQNLKSLNLEGAQYSPFLEITLLKLEELFPDLVILGTDHWSAQSDGGKIESNPAP